MTPKELLNTYYKKMVKEWEANPTWDTAHKIFKDILTTDEHMEDNDHVVALALAWQFFFHTHLL